MLQEISVQPTAVQYKVALLDLQMLRRKERSTATVLQSDL